MAKSALLRYFETREALFLEILDAEWGEWLDALGGALPNTGSGPWAAERAVATAVADSLAQRPLLCDLISVMAGVLERNIGIAFARDFKQRAAENTDRLAQLVATALPWLSPDAAHQFAGAAFVVTAGLWPYARPTQVVATVSAEMGVADPAAAFRRNLRAGLVTQLIGLSAQADRTTAGAGDDH
ncbi:TetR/AcrR family transcriptional regulator [Streptomyces sp. KK5PA1]|uniref:TetR/AcrR family transcriptional regulator n=2 Tax=Actinacidiphila acididurans TaxID=2784346 RepID=A0ABS2TUA7_9ACTN|nr:TetR/AcrR family transcriptional regulator [Actinacidiphila acididurans]